MRDFRRDGILLVFILGLSNTSFSKCVPSASYRATLKVNKCEEAEPGQIFIEGDLIGVSTIDKTVAEPQKIPVKGEKCLFYLGLSPLVRDSNGGWQKRKIGYCLEKKRGTTLKGILSRPCCDAIYPFCQRPVDFLIDESGIPTF